MTGCAHGVIGFCSECHTEGRARDLAFLLEAQHLANTELRRRLARALWNLREAAREHGDFLNYPYSKWTHEFKGLQLERAELRSRRKRSAADGK